MMPSLTTSAFFTGNRFQARDQASTLFSRILIFGCTSVLVYRAADAFNTTTGKLNDAPHEGHVGLFDTAPHKTWQNIHLRQYGFKINDLRCV